MADATFGSLGELDAPSSVGTDRVVEVPGLAESIDAVLAEGLEHPEPGDRSCGVGDDEGLVDEPGDRVQRSRAADACGGVDGGAVDEQGESAEHGLLVGEERVVAPIDG